MRIRIQLKILMRIRIQIRGGGGGLGQPKMCILSGKILGTPLDPGVKKAPEPRSDTVKNKVKNQVDNVKRAFFVSNLPFFYNIWTKFPKKRYIADWHPRLPYPVPLQNDAEPLRCLGNKTP
jgi:hypothetical protein